ncbi:unnamed protein product [Vitrella brassicaformis CCMP3155]|uniref:Uncharacterized protein n=2 Tax=Vitrella brassicaformis TaxID=1169539 RepID=A0A0G4ECD1_VITBC|nr:unnamed protein product [Vitrella brassicaformis CCMP3155]|eukprot:CEL93163.1 unnamed protein product [Vitrella brassicaformis CCMP3155]
MVKGAAAKPKPKAKQQEAGKVTKTIQKKETRVKKAAPAPAPAAAASHMDRGVKLDTEIYAERAPVPKRRPDGTLVFEDYPDFKPNLTPAEVLQRGSFGGTYFRSIYSSVTGKTYDPKQVLAEFPQEWFEGMNRGRMLTSQTYREEVNKYDVKCGQSLDQWESSGWIKKQDPYGAFQWYCRFYLGRRSSDDKRQISRFKGVMGPTGRFRSQLCGQINRRGTRYDDVQVSPVIRQTLQHWGYVLTEADYKAYCKAKKLPIT